MATNIKAKKKKGSYDNKAIVWISVILGALVLAIVAVALIIGFSSNYVAKVNGKKIYTYEYNYFLRQAVTEEYQANFDDFKPENYDDMTDEEQNEVFENFFTDERKVKCEEAALEKARLYKAESILAKKNGFALSSDERATVKTNIDYYISLYMNYGYSQETATYLMTQGAMTLSEYKDFTITQSSIEKYKQSLKDSYDISDAELKAEYDKDPDDFRKISGRVFQFAIPTLPAEPKNSDGVVITKEMAEKEDASTADKLAYENYEKELDEYTKKIANFRTLAENMQTALNASADATFTLYDYDMVTLTPKKAKDDDGNETDADAILEENASFELLCTSQSSFTYNGSAASTTKGVVTVNNDSSSGVKDIDKYLLRAEWNSSRNGFVFKAAEEEDESTASSSSTETTGEEAAKATPSAIEIIEVKDDDGKLTGLYLVRVEDIDDFDSKADGEEDGLNAVKRSVKSIVLEDKATADLEAKVAEGGSKFELKSLKRKALDKIMKEVIG
ncbi:MAG: SurA N-terminal domain-containing protein [Clostridia bacterium]|nr:SurA N-terminal domain-containing protein [Clostridia bacterium]